MARQQTQMNKTREVGGTKGFDVNWKSRGEAEYNHWTKNMPENQIQLAFRSHWHLFNEILGDKKSGKCLEVGCGRGTMSSYFAAAGWDTTLLDYSERAIEIAKKVFKHAKLPAKFVVGDANDLPFKTGTFDAIVSIGLLEHFENIAKPIEEQFRVLKKGGTCFCYIVPEKPDNVQRYFQWVNAGLKQMTNILPRPQKAPKEQIYRSDFGSDRYLEVIKKLKAEVVLVSGVYPLPMISHSPEFPFSLLPKPLEYGLTRVFEGVLAARKLLTGRNPWLCDEDFGQAFLIVFKKR